MVRCQTLLIVTALLTPLAAGGCANYQYRVIEPPEVATTVGEKTDETFTLGPLDYRMREVDDRLVVRIFNRSEPIVQLVGAESYVVGPDGETHPIPAGTIAPGAFVKLIFPPLRPVVPQRRGPSIGIGLGVGISDAHEATARQGDPLYLQVSPGSAYWDWEGEGEIRVSLLYRTDQESWRHTFVIRRVKV